MDSAYDNEDRGVISSEFLEKHQELNNFIQKYNVWRVIVWLLVRILSCFKLHQVLAKS